MSRQSLPLAVSILRRLVRHGTLEVALGEGPPWALPGPHRGPTVGLRFADRGTLLSCALNPDLRVGEAYMDGRLTIERGTLEDLFRFASLNARAVESSPTGRALRLLRTLRSSLVRFLPGRTARRFVAHHYDLGNDLFASFLDADMQYSCAYFEHPGHSLDEAQLAKKRHIVAKLLVEPGHRVLDIGSGWGGLAFYLAELCGAAVRGITLSEAQLELARHRAAERDSIPGVDFYLQDYRAASGRFDRIVSVGMFEHVGSSDYDAFFTKVAELLADDGVMLLHSIGRSDGPSTTNPWIAKYIFPGGSAPALSEVLPAIERSGLIVTDIEVMRLHYAETLKAWQERFLSRRDEARAVYDDRFCRMWEFYLAATECGFRHGGLMVFQIQLAKSLAAVPLTRDYIGAREAALRAKEEWQPDQRIAAE